MISNLIQKCIQNKLHQLKFEYHRLYNMRINYVLNERERLYFTDKISCIVISHKFWNTRIYNMTLAILDWSELSEIQSKRMISNISYVNNRRKSREAVDVSLTASSIISWNTITRWRLLNTLLFIMNAACEAQIS